jgi:hypothetical protein
MAENGNHSSVKKLESNADQNGVIQPLLTGQDRYAFFINISSTYLYQIYIHDMHCLVLGFKNYLMPYIISNC